MYHLDPNINTAIQRQAEQVRAVREITAVTPEPETRSQPHRRRLLGWAALALAAAALVLLAWPLALSGAR